ncbi:hypothetical protein [Pseudonocardia yunnanensis]|uniref:Uncharacterized protein n=1 Tax=Pseudonocardia yunnanensis TaxID=58107 RepID=A0ABW4F5D5_9PSEU
MPVELTSPPRRPIVGWRRSGPDLIRGVPEHAVWARSAPAGLKTSLIQRSLSTSVKSDPFIVIIRSFAMAKSLVSVRL